jgi:Fic family protein
VIPSLPFVPKGRIYRDDAEKVRLEARNGAIQADYVFYTAGAWVPGTRIQPEILLKLQELAINQLYRCAGHLRDEEVFVSDSRGEKLHKPPRHEEVRVLVGQMCDYINDNWEDRSAIHLAAYALWRVNWIHPFLGGNGRTARAFSYLVLCLRLRFTLPADEKTLPELIQEDREPYYVALRDSDKAWGQGRLDISSMEAYLSAKLAEQLVAVHRLASGPETNQ